MISLIAPCDRVFLLVCTRVGDSGIQYLTKGLASTKLMELNLSHCSGINDSSVMKITQRCTRTSIMWITELLGAAYDGMQILFRCKLTYLNLSYCEKLTSACLEWMAGSSIHTLDLSGCNIGDEVQLECPLLYHMTVNMRKLCRELLCFRGWWPWKGLA